MNSGNKGGDLKKEIKVKMIKTISGMKYTLDRLQFERVFPIL